MSASEIERIEDGVPFPRIGRIEVRPNQTLRVTWIEGGRANTTDDVSLAPVINSFKIYRPLRGNEALFSSAKLVEGGDVVAWDGDDLEMTAGTIEELAQQTMTPADFAAFLQRHDLTQGQAAALLGRSRRQIGYYLSTGPIPRIVSLACRGYEADKKKAAPKNAA